MNLKVNKMINNTVKAAQYKLSQHRLQGTKSKLNIFEVAHLMDAVRQSEQIQNTNKVSIFHSVSLN
ncbi:MAG: hypothetical protein RIT43_372 [Bacteroidota bacterium]|jgi:hypothetical protein